MVCIPAEIPKEICDIDDELKAIYHSHDTICFFIFTSRAERSEFMDRSQGMRKEERTELYEKMCGEKFCMDNSNYN